MPRCTEALSCVWVLTLSLLNVRNSDIAAAAAAAAAAVLSVLLRRHRHAAAGVPLQSHWLRCTCAVSAPSFQAAAAGSGVTSPPPRCPPSRTHTPRPSHSPWAVVGSSMPSARERAVMGVRARHRCCCCCTCQHLRTKLGAAAWGRGKSDTAAAASEQVAAPREARPTPYLRVCAPLALLNCTQHNPAGLKSTALPASATTRHRLSHALQARAAQAPSPPQRRARAAAAPERAGRRSSRTQARGGSSHAAQAAEASARAVCANRGELQVGARVPGARDLPQGGRHQPRLQGGAPRHVSRPPPLVAAAAHRRCLRLHHLHLSHTRTHAACSPAALNTPTHPPTHPSTHRQGAGRAVCRGRV